MVKIPSNHRVNSVLGLNPSEANKAKSKTVRDCDKPHINVQNKVSINDVCRCSVSSSNNIETSEQMLHTGVVRKVNNNNTSEQDFVDIAHVNHFAVLCVEDEGDSLDFDTVNNPDASCTVRGFQGGESVRMHDKLGKKSSNFVQNSPVHVSECQLVVESSQTMKNVNQSDKQCNWNTHMASVADTALPASSKGVVTRDGLYNDHTQLDKYCLELQTTLKGEKLRMAKNSSANEKCIYQNTPLFGFIPIYGLQSRIYDRNDNNICQNIMDLHKELRKDGRYNFVGLQVPVKSKLNVDK